ncbi:MAG: ABC transporter substrate-binding protein [Lachnospiraceae bacterium]|nr:ABC transporter substrate-binding protein [Lachnospiraceae bacterium]
MTAFTLSKNIKSKIVTVIAFLFLTLFLSSCDDMDKYGDVECLKWVTYGSSVPLDVKEVLDAANRISAEKIGIVVDLEIQPSDKLNLMMASGESYDMVFASSWVNKFDERAESGMFYDITDIVKEETPDLYEIPGDYWDCTRLGDRIYGIPMLKDMGSECMFRLNADYFEGEKGMKIPERMEFKDIEPFLEAYKKDYHYRYPLEMSSGGVPGSWSSTEGIVDNIIVVPYEVKRNEAKAIAFWEAEDIMEQYRLLHSWYKLGYIHPDAATIDSTTGDTTIPVRFGMAWKGYMGYCNKERWGFNVKTTIYDGPYLSRNTQQGSIIGISAGCSEERVRDCLRYIELLYTDKDFRDVLAYGIEGKHFRYLENGTVLRTQTGSDRYSLGLYQTGPAISASVESPSESVLSDPDQWVEVYKEYEEEGIYSPVNGFVYDPSEFTNTISALRAIFNDYITGLRTGTSDPEEVVPKMKARMEAAGINELIDDVNKQLEEWKEKGSDKGEEPVNE